MTIIRPRFRPRPPARALIEGAQIHQDNDSVVYRQLISTAAPFTYRYRSQTGLRWMDSQVVTASTLFPAGEARQDRVTLTVSTVFACPDRAAYERVISYWGDWQTGLFNASAARRGQGFTLTVGRGWLLSGKGTTLFRDRTMRGEVTLHLTANPTRFLRHQGTADLTTIRASSAVDALRARPDDGPRGLDGNDNVLVDRDQLGGTTFANRETYWNEVVDAFFTHLRALLTEIMAPHSRGGCVPDEDLLEWSEFTVAMGTVETYWELSTRSAPATMALLKMALEKSSPDIECLRYGAGAEGGMPCITIDLTREIRFKVYAKRLDRLRFEITHTDHISQTAGRAGFRGAIFWGLQADAADRMARIWAAITRMLNDEREAGEIADFFLRLRQAGLAGAEYDPVISLMQGNRHLTENAVPRHLLRALVLAGVLDEAASVRHGGIKAYPLAQPWSLMFDQMSATVAAAV